MKGFFSVVGKSLPIFLPLFSLTCLLLVALPSSPSIQLEFATVDTSKVSVKVGKDTFIGLPDAYDYSKHKDFYKIYLWHYCSGKLVDGRQHVDFCSESGRLLYGLFSFWKSWGVAIRKEGGVHFYWLEKGPNLLYITYLVALGVGALTIVASLAVRIHRIVRTCALALAVASVCASLATSILAQITYKLLVLRADEDDIAITAKSGRIVYILNWLSTFLAFIAMILTYKEWHTSHSKAVSEKKDASAASYKMIPEPYKREGSTESLHLLEALARPLPRNSNVSEDRRYEPFNRSN